MGAIGTRGRQAFRAGSRAGSGDARLDVRILGPVEARADGERLPVERPVWRAVLAVLALRAGTPCSAEHLVDALWDERPPARARSVLQSHIARLRRALEPQRAPGAPSRLVVTVAGGYALDVEPESVDAHRFAAAVERGLPLAAGGDAAAALKQFDAALALWRGEPFPALGRTAYAAAERARLAELRRSAATGRLECLLAQRRDAEAVAEAEALVHDDPLHESLWAVLAVGRYRLGRQASALAALSSLRERLAEELGIDPSAELRDLEEGVLNQADWLRGLWPLRREAREPPAPASRIRGAAPLDLLSVRQRMPFVGRQAEHARLRRALAGAADGRSRLLLVAGEPGIGKTRLAVEAASETRARGGIVLAGRCDERLGVPYQPFLEALGAYAQHCDPADLPASLGPMAAHLGRLHPPLLELIGLRPPTAVDPATDRFRLFEAVAGWLRAVGERAPPLMMVVDDLHWATPETLMLVRHLARTPDLRMLLLATYRDTELSLSSPAGDTLAELRAWPGVDHVALRGLTVEDVGALLTAADAEADDAGLDGLARAVEAVTDGNPFFVEQLVAHLNERGRAGGAPARLPDDLSEVEGVRDMVARRLRGLSPEALAILRTAAVAGSEWDVPTLIAATGHEDGTLDAIDDGTRAALLRQVRDEGPTYAFAHELVRQVLEAQVPASRRQRAHLRVADALERTHGPARAGAIAEHLRRAGSAADLGRVVAASLAAAGQSWRQSAFEDASAHCEAALAQLDQRGDGQRGDDPLGVARLRQTLGEAMYATQIDSARGLEQLEAARDSFDQLGDHRSAAAARTRIARFLTTFFDRVDVRRARAQLDAALAVLEPAGPSPELAEALTILAAAAGWDLRADVGRRAGLRAAEISRQFEGAEARLVAEAIAGLSLLADGDLGQGQQLMAAAHAEAVERGEPLATWVAAYAYALSGNLLQDPSGWHPWVASELASGRYEHAAGLRSALMGLLVDWSLAQGQRRDGERLAADLPTDATTSPWKWAHYEGRWDDAARAAMGVADSETATDNRNSATVALWWASRAREHQGRRDEAVRLAERAVGLLPAHPPSWATLWMRGRLAVLLADRDRPRASAQLDACERALASGQDHRGLAGAVALARAVTADGPDEADHAFAAARDAYRRVGHRLLEIDVLWRWGSASGRLEHIDAARALADEAELGEPWRSWLGSARHATGTDAARAR